ALSSTRNGLEVRRAGLGAAIHRACPRTRCTSKQTQSVPEKGDPVSIACKIHMWEPLYVMHRERLELPGFRPRELPGPGLDERRYVPFPNCHARWERTLGGPRSSIRGFEHLCVGRYPRSVFPDLGICGVGFGIKIAPGLTVGKRELVGSPHLRVGSRMDE